MARKRLTFGGKFLSFDNKILTVPPKPKPFTLKMDTTADGSDPTDDEVTLHLTTDYNYDFTIDWGDENTEQINNDDVAISTQQTHTYDTPGEYIVKIYGVFGGLYTNNQTGRNKIMEVMQWGDPVWDNTDVVFYGCNNLKITATDIPNWENVTYFSGIFRSCTSLTEIPSGLFDNNTESVGFDRCFRDCTSLTEIPSGLFDNNTKVKWFSSCFENCSSLTEIPSGLFDSCTEVIDFGGLFESCSLLETIPSSLFDYNTKVEDFYYCFENCTSLQLSGITVVNWSVGNVNAMNRMFNSCTSITDIPGIEHWEPFKLSSASWSGMRDMLLNVTLPTERYSQMLIEWASKADQFENTGIYLGGGNSKYNTDGETARNTLTSAPYNWNITDGGLE